ncbi:hypothetical protein KR044_001151 [Drosophila immigrans]|nr:hypothetical protein KR044_001151 [Drosophila immigrans]
MSITLSKRHCQQKFRQWQETEETKRQEHKQQLKSGTTNISEVYDDEYGDDNDDDSKLHNQNNKRRQFLTATLSVSGLPGWKQEQAVESTIVTLTYTLLIHLPCSLLILILHYVDCSLAAEYYSNPTFNISATELPMLFNKTTNATAAPVTTASPFNKKEFDAADRGNASEYIFDRTDVRIIFITLYTLVFCCCFFGNLLVILVVTLSRRLRSITNFFLANLAFADFCVGLFCVLQNLSIYLIDSWVFGEFLCRMYQFVHSLSYTASIFILVVICMERYFAIVHPITCKQILTATRLRMVIVTVWITSAVYSTPKFVFSKTIKNIHTEDGLEEEICVLDREMFNSKLLDMINFVLLYAMPLLVMTVLYSKIAIALWRSSRGLTPHSSSHYQQSSPGQETSMSLHNSMYHRQSHHNQLRQLPAGVSRTMAPGEALASLATGSNSASLSRQHSSKYEKHGITESQVSLEADQAIVSTCRKPSLYHHSHMYNPRGSGGGGGTHMTHSSNNVLRARRGVVRMLIIFVLTFALCNLPYHARKMWQYWSRSYRGDSNFNALLTPLTFLITYFNSGVNPLLYAFLSRNFRKGMREMLLCSWKKGKGKSSSNSSMHHKRKALQTHSLPTETTHIGNEQL